ncbi:MAG: YfhO family protein [Anaerolineaceae bacterium]|nr:YfhO family protein [Anaerolineaceae bacterium]
MNGPVPRKDLLAIGTLLLLWLVFFWRLFTPVDADRASLRKGDFSGQFVAFGAYQYERMSQGEVPLWNPWNNGGMPFIADPQTAAFYPPRLLTIALGSLTDGWSFFLLELEMAAHVLAFSLLMYLLLRRMTLRRSGSVPGALLAAIISGYCGWTTGYPPLQLAILESAIWLPAVILGVFEATETRPLRWRWLMVSGLATGLSWLAGHSQTSWQLSLLLVAWVAWRTWEKRLRWHYFLRMLAFTAIWAPGLAAVQLLPGIEYLLRTGRAQLGIDAKGNGFPLRDLLQFLFPAQFSLFSPLYIGIAGLAMVLIAVQQRLQAARFWLLAALFALVLSMGNNLALFSMLYNVLPGLRWFRGQERAAFLVSHSLAIVSGLTLAKLADSCDAALPWTVIRRTLGGMLAIGILVMALAPLGWPGFETPDILSAALLAVILTSACWFLLRKIHDRPIAYQWVWMFVLLLVFDLFSVNMYATGTWEGVPAHQQLSMSPPELLIPVLADEDQPFRVDGLRVVHENYGSLYQVADIRGISPLFLTGPRLLIGWEGTNPLAWELFAVRYVFSDQEPLPIPVRTLAEGHDYYGPVRLHRLEDPRPWAHLVQEFVVLDGDKWARELLDHPDFDERQVIILDRAPVPEPDAATSPGSARVTSFSPEYVEVRTSAPANAILSLAQPHYPGWRVFIDGEESELLRAYGALSAVALTAGDHIVELQYDPLTWKLGALLSGLTLLFSLAFSLLPRLRRP